MVGAYLVLYGSHKWTFQEKKKKAGCCDVGIKHTDIFSHITLAMNVVVIVTDKKDMALHPGTL